MKKNSTFLIFIVCCFIATASSCKKNISYKPDIPKSEGLSDFIFLNEHLKQLAIDIEPLIKNSTARSSIINKAKQKFDGEHEVLLKDVFSDGLIKSLVSTDIIEKSHRQLFERSGTHIYPQIYIPKYQFLEDNNIQATISDPINLNEDPVLVFNTGNSAVDNSKNEIVPGFKLENGKLTFAMMIDEQYANTHEVWVLGINEVVDKKGNYINSSTLPTPNLPLPPDDDTGGGGGGGGGTTGDPDDDPDDAPLKHVPFPELQHPKINFKLQYMKVYNLKESWLSGAAEVAIKAKLVCHNGRVEGQRYPAIQKEYSSDQYSNKLGKLVRKVNRNEKDKQLTINYALQTNWQVGEPTIDPIHFMYVMFERDPWPANAWQWDKYALPSPFYPSDTPPGKFTLWSRSSNNYDAWPYGNHYFTGSPLLANSGNTYAGTGYVINNDIEYNTSIY